MASEAERIEGQQPVVPQQRKEDEKKGAADKYDFKSKISLGHPVRVAEFLDSPNSRKEKEILHYLKDNFDKFGKIIETIKKKGKDFPFLLRKRGDEEVIYVMGLPPQDMPLPWYSTHNYFGNYPIERAVKERRKDMDPKKVVWDAIRFGISDENRNYGESPNKPMARRMTYYLNVALAQNEKGREFLKKLMKGFVKTAQSSEGKEKIRGGVFEAEGKNILLA